MQTEMTQIPGTRTLKRAPMQKKMKQILPHAEENSPVCSERMLALGNAALSPYGIVYSTALQTFCKQTTLFYACYDLVQGGTACEMNPHKAAFLLDLLVLLVTNEHRLGSSPGCW